MALQSNYGGQPQQKKRVCNLTRFLLLDSSSWPRKKPETFALREARETRSAYSPEKSPRQAPLKAANKVHVFEANGCRPIKPKGGPASMPDKIWRPGHRDAGGTPIAVRAQKLQPRPFGYIRFSFPSLTAPGIARTFSEQIQGICLLGPHNNLLCFS